MAPDASNRASRATTVVVPNLLNAVVGIVAGGLVVAVVTVVARLRKGAKAH